MSIVRVESKKVQRRKTPKTPKHKRQKWIFVHITLKTSLYILRKWEGRNRKLNKEEIKQRRSQEKGKIKLWLRTRGQS